jgi:hypothetical protein
MQEASVTPTRDRNTIASPAEVAAAMALWEQSEHAHTYDGGLGADTTCARCKSPFNWDPAAPAAEAAQDCASCKRVPGEARPVLESGEPVSQDEWRNIDCSICHEPVGNSYRIAPSIWNQELGVYEPVESSDELCAHCHEGRHGFEVAEEVRASEVHQGWACLDCHNPHGDDISCSDCHDTMEDGSAEVHNNHLEVHCTACHDNYGLATWRERDTESDFYDTVITIRFAHTLTAWPSHNLQTAVDCRDCHHARDIDRPALVQTVSCGDATCHPQGAVLSWCPYFTTFGDVE